MSIFKKTVLSLSFLILMLLSSGSPMYGEWSSMNPPYESSEWRLNSVHLTSPDEGWAVGSVGSDWRKNYTGILLHYSGNEWIHISSPTVNTDSWELNSVHFTSPDEGWAVGWALETDWSNENGVLLHYSRGAWKSISPPSISNEWWLNSVYFTSAGEGWAVGSAGSTWSSNYSGCLLHYSGGKWISISPPYISSEWRLNSVHFTSPDEGWAVGSDCINKRGVLLHYSSKIWRSVYPPQLSNDWQLNSVHFTSPDEGWAVGSDWANKRGVLLHYSSSIWRSVYPPSVSTHWELNSVYFTSPDEGWAVGSDLFYERGVLVQYISSAPVPLLPDLTGQWVSIEQKCKKRKKEMRCKIKGILTIQNIGYEDADSSYVQFYLSDDNIYDLGDTFLKEMTVGKRMKAGKIKNKKLKYKMPYDVTANGKYIIAVIDADNSVVELNESNNTIVYGPFSEDDVNPSSATSKPKTSTANLP
jgi:hypothetical protein